MLHMSFALHQNQTEIGLLEHTFLRHRPRQRGNVMDMPNDGKD